MHKVGGEEEEQTHTSFPLFSISSLEPVPFLPLQVFAAQHLSSWDAMESISRVPYSLLCAQSCGSFFSALPINKITFTFDVREIQQNYICWYSLAPPPLISLMDLFPLVLLYCYCNGISGRRLDKYRSSSSALKWMSHLSHWDLLNVIGSY